MKLRPDQLAEQLRKPLLPVYLICGSEPLFIEESATLIRRAAKQQQFDEREPFFANEKGFAWHSLLANAQNLSLFSQKKLIELRWPKGKSTPDSQAVLKQYFEKPPQDTFLLILCDKLDSSTLNTKWCKTILAMGAIVQCWPVKPHELPRFIATRLRTHGLNATPEALQLFADCVEGNLLAANQTIEKLALSHQNTTITDTMISDVLGNHARFNQFELADQVIQGNVNRIPTILQALQSEAASPVLILWSLCREIRILCHLREALETRAPLAPIFQAQRVWPQRQALYQQALQRHTTTECYGFLQTAKQVDEMIKGGLPHDPWQALLRLCLSIAGAPLFGTTEIP